MLNLLLQCWPRSLSTLIIPDNNQGQYSITSPDRYLSPYSSGISIGGAFFHGGNNQSKNAKIKKGTMNHNKDKVTSEPPIKLTL